MTWRGVCRLCGSHEFTITIGSSQQAHVNCGKPECDAYIGCIWAEDLFQVNGEEPHVIAEPH